jgi:hypothetical protein
MGFGLFPTLRIRNPLLGLFQRVIHVLDHLFGQFSFVCTIDHLLIIFRVQSDCVRGQGSIKEVKMLEIVSAKLPVKSSDDSSASLCMGGISPLLFNHIGFFSSRVYKMLNFFFVKRKIEARFSGVSLS